jgi:hypothetical protein
MAAESHPTHRESAGRDVHGLEQGLAKRADSERSCRHAYVGRQDGTPVLDRFEAAVAFAIEEAARMRDARAVASMVTVLDGGAP